MKKKQSILSSYPRVILINTQASPDFKNQIDEVQEAVRDTFAKANETAALAEKLNVSFIRIDLCSGHITIHL